MKPLYTKVLVYGGLVVCLVYVVTPFLWTFVSSLKLERHILEMSVRWIPRAVTLDHYKWVLGFVTERVTTTSKSVGLLGSYKNAAIATSGATFLVVILAILGGYALTRFDFPGRVPIAVLVLSTALFPVVLMIVPWYLILQRLGLIDTYLGLILSMSAFVTPFSVWLMKGFITSIPPSLEECAMMDGCSKLGAFVRVTLPLLGSGVAAVGMYTVVMVWNAYLIPLIVCGTKSTKPISIVLIELFSFYGRTYWGGLMAATVVTCIPVIVLFVFLQAHFISGMTAGAVKG